MHPRMPSDPLDLETTTAAAVVPIAVEPVHGAAARTLLVEYSTEVLRRWNARQLEDAAG